MATSLVRSLFTGSEEADTILLEGTFPAVCIHSVNTSLFILKCHNLKYMYYEALVVDMKSPSLAMTKHAFL